MTESEQTEKLMPNTQLEEGETKEVAVDPRVFVCSFPKSGTHLVEQLVQPFVLPMPADKPWSGTFKGNSWTLNRIPVKKTLQRIGWIRDGTYAKGHLGYSEVLENYLWGIGAAVLFIYRDPRDVAVSLTHHILDDKPHPHNEWYQEMDFDGALMAVIQGIGPYAGVMRRWNEYAGWLACEWIGKLRYGDIMADKPRWSRIILDYIVEHSAAHRGYDAAMSDELREQAVELMVANSEHTERSPTFRKGGSGGWREAFKTAHCVAFAESDMKAADEYGLEEPWMTALKFEDDEDWWREFVETDDEESEEAE